LVKKGELKPRIVLNDTDKSHFTVFLREDNYQFLKIEEDAPPSDMEDYDKRVTEWAEQYKQKMADRR
jgi:hydrogenase maturation factor HypE